MALIVEQLQARDGRDLAPCTSETCEEVSTLNNITALSAQTGKQATHPDQAEDVSSHPQWFVVRVTGPGEPVLPETYHLDELRRSPSIAPLILSAEAEDMSFTGCTLVLDQWSEEDGENQEPTILHVYVDE